MKKTMMTSMIALLSILSACAVDYSDEDDVSEDVSEVTSPVVCTGVGVGTCTAATMPTSWTIQPASGTVRIDASGLTVNWTCISMSTTTRIVTAVGVGTATVRCSRTWP